VWLSRSENIATRHVGAGHLLATRDWTWIAARCSTRWKPAVGLASPPRLEHQPAQLVVEILRQVALQRLEVDAAGRAPPTASWSLGERQQQVLEGARIRGGRSLA
jgi:hypothetical protein